MAATDTIDYATLPTPTLDHIPGEKGWPLLGLTPRFLRDAFALHRGLRDKHGPVYKHHILSTWGVSLAGPDALEYVLMDRDKNFSSELGWKSTLSQLFPRGLMLRDFDDHRKHRRIMQVAFKAPAMRDYLRRMNDGIALELDQWGTNPSFHFYPAIKQLTLNLGASVFLGLDMGDQARALNQAFADEVAAAVAPIRKPLPFTAMRRGVDARQFLTDTFAELIPARREGEAEDMFSQLCRAESEDGERLTDAEIVDHMNFLLMAAHDTTTSSVTTMAWALAAFPDWQERVRQEVMELGGERAEDGIPEQMTLTDATFREALRFMPPVPFLPRRALRDFQWGGFDIPAGTGIVVHPGLVMRDPEIWTDPESFDPARFLSNRAEDKAHRFAWSPYGGGAHKCLGMHFAALQVKAFTFQLLRRYRLVLPEGHEPTWLRIPIPKPKEGLPIRLEAL
ncbi:MAG: cytochrome P450 [Alphaproteobacteria bacterium]